MSQAQIDHEKSSYANEEPEYEEHISLESDADDSNEKSSCANEEPEYEEHISLESDVDDSNGDEESQGTGEEEGNGDGKEEFLEEDMPMNHSDEEYQVHYDVGYQDNGEEDYQSNGDEEDQGNGDEEDQGNGDEDQGDKDDNGGHGVEELVVEPIINIFHEENEEICREIVKPLLKIVQTLKSKGETDLANIKKTIVKTLDFTMSAEAVPEKPKKPRSRPRAKKQPVLPNPIRLSLEHSRLSRQGLSLTKNLEPGRISIPGVSFPSVHYPISTPAQTLLKNNIKLFPCSMCKGTFLKMEDLKMHEIKLHKPGQPLQQAALPIKLGEPGNAKATDKIDKDSKDLKTEPKSESTTEATATSDETTPSKPEIKRTKNPTTFCKICKKGFCNVANLNRHRNTVHLKRKPHVCQVCHKPFGQRSVLRTHMKQIHPDTYIELSNSNSTFADVADLQKCQLCHDWFANAVFLKIHMDNEHSDIVKMEEEDEIEDEGEYEDYEYY